MTCLDTCQIAELTAGYAQDLPVKLFLIIGFSTLLKDHWIQTQPISQIISEEEGSAEMGGIKAKQYLCQAWKIGPKACHIFKHSYFGKLEGVVVWSLGDV